MTSNDSFGARSTLTVNGRDHTIYRLGAAGGSDLHDRLPYSLKILLENLLRNEDGVAVTADDVRALAAWNGTGGEREIAFMPARVLMQDFTGVPAIVDLATMRDAMANLGGDPARINPQVPVELVIDHSVQIDEWASNSAFAKNVELEFHRNRERYEFLRWGQTAFDNFRVVPPGTGICHQVNLEYLARTVFVDGNDVAYPDTVVGTDSHTPMVNGLGVVGWGVGGIEAEAAMLGQPITMLVPPVVGIKLHGELPEGATATDLVLTVTERLRKHGVVGKFVEFYGPGLSAVPVENRATIGNMSPEYGSTITIFPIDEQTLRYLEFSGRSAENIALVEAYAKEQGLWHDPARTPVYTETLELDLSAVVPSLAGPARPQDRVPLDQSKAMFAEALPKYRPADADPNADINGMRHGNVVIASITSCTNTSNPSVLIAAGLLAKKAVERGLSAQPWVKTSLAPGSQVVPDYLDRAGVQPYLDKLGFEVVGFGCTTCIGNSGPLDPDVSEAIEQGDLAVAAVLSGNRNFEGRIHPLVRMNYLASPPLVVAYAISGRMDWDPYTEPLGTGSDGAPVFLRDVWPSNEEVAAVVRDAVTAEMFRTRYADVFTGDDAWRALAVPEGDRFAWSTDSTYVRQAPYFDAMAPQPAPVVDIRDARVLAVLGDSVTTDHISPAGSIKATSPAGQWLMENGVEPPEFNSYGARRGNHEVMVRGTFANVRIRNQLAPGTEGGVTRYLPTGDEMSIYDAAMRYRADNTPTIVLAGKEYGSGSSRDWAAKGPNLLGIRAAIAESFERIHRSNLIGMGILPLQFLDGDSVASLGLTGHETFTITGLETLAADAPMPETLHVQADQKAFDVKLRIDTPVEAEYYRNGGILQFVLRHLSR
ncbi:MAG: aconitate hydratase AcnA [Acidimicrobiia bacterium]